MDKDYFFAKHQIPPEENPPRENEFFEPKTLEHENRFQPEGQIDTAEGQKNE